MSSAIAVRHSRSCPANRDKHARCTCKPSYRAAVYDRRSGTWIRKTFHTKAEAKGWRADANVGLRKGTLRAPTKITVREAADGLIEGMKSGAVRTRSGDMYKPSAVRGYEQVIRERLVEEFGPVRLADLQRADLQRFADRLLGAGLSPSRIRNVLMPLRVIFRRAVEDGIVAVNPTANLRLPAVRGTRDRIASPEEAARLLAALPGADRALWGTALYGGLRRGELRGLRWEDIDLASGVIRVERAMDETGAMIEPKSTAGKRKVPIPAALRELLIEHKLACAWSEGFIFGSQQGRPFTPSAVRRRALTAWARANAQESLRAEQEGREPDLLDPIGLHEARHTYASLMIAAGVNAKALQTYMGDSSVTVTFDRYGHLMPGNEEEAAGLLDAYLMERANTTARLARVEA
jgi:integrase